MKNKITKLFLALLAITLGGNAQAQDNPMPDYVRKATNVEFLQNFAKQKSAEFEVNYNKAVEIAREQGKPISGEKDGYTYALVGYDSETQTLKYFRTTNNSVTNSSLSTANAKPLHLKGIKGAGMKVAVWDGGVGLPGHLAFTGGRYVIKDNGNTPSWVTTLGKNHSAHVAGTTAGGSFGDGTTMGFATEAQVYAYNWAGDTSEMAAAASDVTNPIYTSNHSYGLDFQGGSTSIFGQYNQDARDYDLVANNAPYYTIVFAAGNDREEGFNTKVAGKDLLSQGGVSKNLVVVAATRGTDDFAGVTGPGSVNKIGGVDPFIASFSNYGPTDDFRIKPDIAAKGVGVKSITAVGITTTDTYNGTSMAAPAVTGVFTLWQQYYNQQFSKFMRSASVRALMAHTAREAGPAAGPDFMFGWGLIDAEKGVLLMDDVKANVAYFQEHDLIQGNQFNYEFEYNGQQDLVVTVAWNDPAGSATTLTDSNVKKLVNDLDVRLINTDTNTTYYPWALAQNWVVLPTSTSIAVNNGDNARDNIEKIEPGSRVAGKYRVEVSHKGSTLTGGSQNFSIIVSGAVGSVSTASLALESIKLYPNPVKDILTLEGNLNDLNNGSIDVYDTAGKKVMSSVIIQDNSMSIDVSHFKSGLYILTVTKDSVKQHFKFIKN